MRINIQAPWEINPYLDKVINEKLEKLWTFNQNIIRADVFLKKGSNVGEEDKQMEVRLRTGQGEFFAQANADNFEKAVTMVANKLRTQLIKKKELTQ